MLQQQHVIHDTSAVAHERQGAHFVIPLVNILQSLVTNLANFHTNEKLLTAYKIITFFPALISSQNRKVEFSFQPVTEAFCSLFGQSHDSWPHIVRAIHLSPLLPHVLDSAKTPRMHRQNKKGRQISNRKTHAHAEKVFHYFQKDCQGFSQGSHDPCFISLPFPFIFLLLFHK